MDFQKSITKENLARSFAAECQEGARYQFLAEKAQQEGYQYIMTFVRSLAKNEMSHAKMFFQAINEHGGDKVQNIDVKAGYPFRTGELAEIFKMEAENERMSGENIYPKFADIARDEGFSDVAELFELVSKVEITHKNILTNFYNGLKKGTLYKSKSGVHAFKCDECGTIVEGKSAPKTCPLCKNGQGYFRVDFSII